MLIFVLFWLFLYLTYYLKDTGIVFSGCSVPPDSMEIVLSSDRESSPSAGKNTGVVLVPCCAWKCVSTAISGGVDIFEVPRCPLLRQMNSQWGSQKLLQGLVSHELTVYLSVFYVFLTQWIMAILSKRYKPGNFESNKLKHSLKVHSQVWDHFWQLKAR